MTLTSPFQIPRSAGSELVPRSRAVESGIFEGMPGDVGRGSSYAEFLVHVQSHHACRTLLSKALVKVDSPRLLPRPTLGQWPLACKRPAP